MIQKLTNFLARSRLRSLVELYHRELEQHQQAVLTFRSWKAVLLASRRSAIYPLIIALLAVISAGTGTYPYSPVLIAAVVFAPFRWQTIYVSAVLGAATGAGLLAITLQFVGSQHLPGFFADILGTLEGSWVRHWVDAYGAYALAAVAALPIPEMPTLLALILAGTPPWVIWLAIFAGKSIKYGVYILAVLLILRAIRHGHEHKAGG